MDPMGMDINIKSLRVVLIVSTQKLRLPSIPFNIKPNKRPQND